LEASQRSFQIGGDRLYLGIAFIGWTVHDYVFPDRASMGDGPAWLEFDE
jgi:hypothetical protein